MSVVLTRDPIVDKCVGCGNIVCEDKCRTYLYPESKWTRGNCPMATHLQKEAVREKEINPLKASKRSMKKR